MLKLQKYLWGEDQAQRDAYLKWKYNHNPYVDDIYIYVAFCNEQLIGMIGAYGVQWEVGKYSQTVTGISFADLVIHPNYRNQNLFPKLIAFALEDLSKTNYTYAFDLSATSHVAIVLLMQGWRKIYIQTANRQTKIPTFTSMYRQLRGHVRDLTSQHVYKSCSSFTDLDMNANQIRDKASSYVSLSKTLRPLAMAELAERNRANGRIRHVKDEQYFNWRFRNPLSEYRFLFWENECLDGYLVLHTKPGPYGEDTRANIVDWEATNEQVWTDLLKAVIQYGNFKEIYIWSETLSDSVKTLLRKAGFVFTNKAGSVRNDVYGENILVKPLCQKIQQTNWVLDGKDLLDSTNWDLRMIYSDNY